MKPVIEKLKIAVSMVNEVIFLELDISYSNKDPESIPLIEGGGVGNVSGYLC